MKKIVLVILVLFLSNFVYSQEQRLDNASGTIITCLKFQDKSGYYSTGANMVTISDNDPACVDILFPAKWTVIKMFIISSKSQVTSNLTGKKEVSTMCNFLIKSKSQYGDFTEVRRITSNTLTKLEIKQKIVTNGIRIQLLPYNNDSRNVTFGDMAFEIWGYQGDAPKQEKIKIKTKEDAKKALKLNEITPKEYMLLLKTLSE